MLDIAAGLKQWRESQRKCKMDDGLARSKETVQFTCILLKKTRLSGILWPT